MANPTGVFELVPGGGFAVEINIKVKGLMTFHGSSSGEKEARLLKELNRRFSLNSDVQGHLDVIVLPTEVDRMFQEKGPNALAASPGVHP